MQSGEALRLHGRATCAGRRRRDSRTRRKRRQGEKGIVGIGEGRRRTYRRGRRTERRLPHRNSYTAIPTCREQITPRPGVQPIRRAANLALTWAPPRVPSRQAFPLSPFRPPAESSLSCSLSRRRQTAPTAMRKSASSWHPPSRSPRWLTPGQSQRSPIGPKQVPYQRNRTFDGHYSTDRNAPCQHYFRCKIRRKRRAGGGEEAGSPEGEAPPDDRGVRLPVTRLGS